MVSLAAFAHELTKIAVSPLGKEMAKATLWGMGFEGLLNRDATPLSVVREGVGFGVGDVGASRIAKGMGYGRVGQFLAGMAGGNALAAALRNRFKGKPIQHAVDKLPDTPEFQAIKQAAAKMSILTPQSSNVSGYSYDPKTESLNVTYKSGGTYTYKGVKANAVKALKRNKSVGKTINKLRAGLEYEKVGADQFPYKPVVQTLDQRQWEPGYSQTRPAYEFDRRRMKRGLVGRTKTAKQTAFGEDYDESEKVGAAVDLRRYMSPEEVALVDEHLAPNTIYKDTWHSPSHRRIFGIPVKRTSEADLRNDAADRVRAAHWYRNHPEAKAGLGKTAKMTAFGEDYYDESEDAGWKDKIPGGLADKKTPADFDPKALSKGIKVEVEHTKDRAMAMEIAMDHLSEDPAYYDKLEKIEKKAAPRRVIDEVIEALRIREIKRRAGTLRDVKILPLGMATPPPIPLAALKRRGNVLKPVSGEIVKKSDIIKESMLRERIREGAPSIVEKMAARRRSMMKAAGVAKKQISFDGLPLKIEQEPGDVRKGVSGDGTPWSRKMYVSYGYVPGTKGMGEDGDAIDVYLSNNPIPGSKVFTVKQNRKDGSFDESKHMLGYASAADAKADYLKHMPSWAFGSMESQSWDSFKGKYGKKAA